MRPGFAQGCEKYLNAPRVHTKLLHENGFITPFVPAQKRNANVSRYAFRKADLDDFLSRLLADAQTLAEPTKNIQDLPGAAKRANCSVIEIVRLVLDRKLIWIGRRLEVAGYLSLLVQVDEIRRFVRGTETDGLAEHKVIDELKVSWQAVRALVDDGILPTTMVINPVNRCPTRVVLKDDLRAFRATYVTLFQLAKERGIHQLALKKDLVNKGITPALSQERFRASFYRRSELVL
jgi:hypothetical protein